MRLQVRLICALIFMCVAGCEATSRPPSKDVSNNDTGFELRSDWTNPSIGGLPVEIKFPQGVVTLTGAPQRGVESITAQWIPSATNDGREFTDSIIVVKVARYIVAVGTPSGMSAGGLAKQRTHWNLLNIGRKLVPLSLAYPEEIEVGLYRGGLLRDELGRETVKIHGQSDSVSRKDTWVWPELGDEYLEYDSPYGRITIAPKVNPGQISVWVRWSTGVHGFEGAIRNTIVMLRVSGHIVALGTPSSFFSGGLSYQSSGWWMFALGSELVPAEEQQVREIEVVVFRLAMPEIGLYGLDHRHTLTISSSAGDGG